MAFHCLKGACKMMGAGLLAGSVGIRQGMMMGLHLKKIYFKLWVVKPWHSLPREVVAAPYLEVFKAMLGGAWSTLV